MARAEDILQRLLENGEMAIDDLILDRQSEELFLDFKRSADNGSGGRLHENDRNNLAKAISGFGNSEGGVIIWGVDCSRQASIGDVANAKVPIHNPKRFKSWLEGAVSGCTVPPHSGVQHEVIESSDKKTGFVVTHIRKSYLAPHQCLKPLQYYIRAGSDFIPTPHAVLMGLFGRPPQPFVFHMWSYPPAHLVKKVVVKNDRTVLAAEFDLEFRLSSYGPGLARDLYVNLQILPPGPDSTALVMPVDTNNWSGRHSLGRFTNLVSNESFKLAPMAIVNPVTLRFSLVPPFESALIYEISYGHGGSPITKIEGRVKPEVLQAAYDVLAAASDQEKKEAGHQFIVTVMNIKDPGANQDRKA